MWDPSTYLRFGDERSRPFGDLLARIAAHAPVEVVDLGCGPGTLTVHLASRWPTARVHGLGLIPGNDFLCTRARLTGAVRRG